MDKPSKILQKVRKDFERLIHSPSSVNVKHLTNALINWKRNETKEFNQLNKQVPNLIDDMALISKQLIEGQNKLAERAKNMGIYGITISPSSIEKFASKLTFDSVGRVIGLKVNLKINDVRELLSQQITPLSQLNAVGEQSIPKTESVSLITFVNLLSNNSDHFAKNLSNQAKNLWLSGQVNNIQSVALYKSAIKQLNHQPELKAMVESLLEDAEKFKSPTQYIDNLYGRHFDAEFVHSLIKNPSQSALFTGAQTGRALVKEFDESFEKLGVDPLKREESLNRRLRGFAKSLSSDHRPWFNKVPELTNFIAEPNYHRFKTMMTKVENGFDMIKIPFLAVRMSVADGMGLQTMKWKSECDKVYMDSILNERSTNDVISSNPTIKATLGAFKTHSYGPKLPHQQFGQKIYSDFDSGKNVTIKNILTPGKETQFEKNSLSHGHAVVNGASGSTNIMVHLNKHLGSKLGNFSQEQAFVNTLAFLVFDGGHSVNESMGVYKALAAEKSQLDTVLQSYTVNYQHIAELLPTREQGIINNALIQAFDSTLDLQRQLKK